MMTKVYLVCAYALIVLVGGLIGYLKAASLPSLLMGGAFSLLLFWCAYFIYQKSPLAYYASAGLTSVLFLFFLYRFSLSFKWMPAGMMSALSLALLLALILIPNKKIA